MALQHIKRDAREQSCVIWNTRHFDHAQSDLREWVEQVEDNV